MKPKDLVLYWSKKYLEKIGLSYVINWKRDTALTKNFLDQINDTKFVKQIIDYIFEQNLAFYDLSFLLGYKINRWIQEILIIKEEQELIKKISKGIRKQKREK